VKQSAGEFFSQHNRFAMNARSESKNLDVTTATLLP
jgi:hypothetical protein